MAHSSVNQWHASGEFQTLVKQFHDRSACSPKITQMQAAKQHLTHLVARLRNYLQSVGVVSDVNYQGSSYEGIKTRSSDLEFDCLVVLKNGNHLSKVGGVAPGFYKLRVNSSSPLNAMSDQGYLSPKQIRSHFSSEMTKAINALGLTNTMKIRYHGPAVQLDVYKPNCSSLWYSVDMVAGYKVGNESFVAKPCPNDQNSWRQSFSQDERNLLDAADRGSGCRKEVVRMLKVIREVDPALRSMESYIVKMTLMNMMRDQYYLPWHRGQLGACLVDMMSKLRDYLNCGNLPSRWVHGLNLLQGYSGVVRDNMAARLTSLLNSKDKMTQLLRSTI